MSASAVRSCSGWTLSQAFRRLLDESNLSCAPTTRLNHQQQATYLLRYFGDRPLADFAGEAGAALVLQYIQDESGGKERSQRETFAGPGNLVRALSYTTIRGRLGTLRKALEFAAEHGELTSLPTPWPVPPRGSHGHLDRGRYLLHEEHERMRSAQPPKRRPPAVERATGADKPAPDGAVTLQEALGWLFRPGIRKRSEATIAMHRKHARWLLAFFGNRAIADFEGTAGYRLLLEYVEIEGPGGRNVKCTSIAKRLCTLRLALREGERRGHFAKMPPWPELAADAEPRTRYLSFDEYQRLRPLMPPREMLWIDLAVWTGQHNADVNTMTWGMVDLGGGAGAPPAEGPAFWLRRNTKNRARDQWLPMPDELRAILTTAWHATKGPGPEALIVGEPSYRNFLTKIARACWKLGIPRFSPIDLRRTCATWWVDRAGPKDALRAWLGHSHNSAMVEKHYSQVTPLMLNEGVAALNRASRRPGAETSAPQVGSSTIEPGEVA